MGLLDYSARFYDPSIARFTSVDPLADQFASWNPYHYVHNNPMLLTDPTGMSAENNNFPPEDFEGNSYTDLDGSFTRDHSGADWNWTNTQGQDQGLVLSELRVFDKQPSEALIDKANDVTSKVSPVVGVVGNNLKNDIEKAIKRSTGSPISTKQAYILKQSLDGPVKTRFGTMSASNATKLSRGFKFAGIAGNFISIGYYGNEIYNGNKAKGATGLGVMLGVAAISVACPVCPIVGVGLSAGYSFLLEDYIFPNNKINRL